jgi:hypothetical protein
VSDIDDTRPDGESAETDDNDALLSRLRLIEDQPLEARASAFSQIHQELQETLESGDSGRQRG